MEAALGLGGLFLAALSFLFGRMFSQSEAVLAEKRRIYEEFLVVCPHPNWAYQEWTPDRESELAELMQSNYGKLCLYASSDVMFALQRYLELLLKADTALGPTSAPGALEYKASAKAHNDLILEMRRDALSWSMFGYSGKSRLPKDRLEAAKASTLD